MSKKRKRKQEVKRLQREKQEALNIIGSYIRASRADYRLVLELKERIAELETELEAEQADLLSATVTIEHIRDNLLDAITRLGDWLNTQGDTSTSLSGGHTEETIVRPDTPEPQPTLGIYPSWADYLRQKADLKLPEKWVEDLEQRVKDIAATLNTDDNKD